MPSASALLAALTLAGAVVAAWGFIFGLTHEFYVKEQDGKRTLLPAGRRAIGITLLGVTLALASFLVNLRAQSEAAAKAAEGAQQGDEKWRQAALASEPLRSLKVEW